VGADCVIADPNHTGQMIYAVSPSGSTEVGLYEGASINPATSTQLQPATYDDISMLQATSSGAIFFIGTVSGTSYLYELANGAVTEISQADTAASTIDGTIIAFTMPGSSGDLLYVMSTAGGGTPTLLVGTGNNLYPAFSKDNTKIVYSGDNMSGSSTPFDLYEIPTAGGTPTQITNTPTLSELGASFNGNGTELSCVLLSSDSTQCGIGVISGSTETLIVNDTNIPTTTYWTTSSGRGIGVHSAASHFQRLKGFRPRRVKRRAG